MKTKHLTLLAGRIVTKSLDVGWHRNDQIRCYMELNDGKLHGDSKWWRSGGRLRWHYICENDKRIKRIV